MKIDAGRFAAASATVFAMAGLICALTYKAWPEGYATVANFLLHTNMFTATRSLGWGEAIAAAAAWWVIVATVVGASAIFYNRMARTS